MRKSGKHIGRPGRLRKSGFNSMGNPWNFYKPTYRNSKKTKTSITSNVSNANTMPVNASNVSSANTMPVNASNVSSANTMPVNAG